MPAIVLPEGKQSFEDGNGNPLVGGKVYTYAAGTTTPQTTWSDANKIGANTNPIILDARGEATIFWDGAYKVVLKDSLDNTIWTVDNIKSASISFPVTPEEQAAGVVVVDTGYEVGNVLRYGADKTGVASSAVAFQAAGTVSGRPHGPRGTYLIDATVLVPSSTVYDMDPGTIIKAKMTATEATGYITTIFQNADLVNGNTDIAFKNIKFDCNRGAFNWAQSATLTTGQAFNFKFVTGLVFENCWVDNFLCGLNTTNHSTGNINILSANMSIMNQCTDVYFRRLRTTRIAVEGWGFYKCTNVSFDGWDANGINQNSTDRTSSHIAAWLCVGFKVTNCNVVHTGGSVFNNYGRDIEYNNVKVNWGQAQLGQGFDFGDEAILGDATFTPGNVKVANCYLNVIRTGINWAGDNYGVLPENIEISNSTILVNGIIVNDFCTGIQMRTGRNINITNNRIVMTGAFEAQTSAFAGAAIMFRPGTTLPRLQNVLIENNNLEGYAGVIINTLSINTVDARTLRRIFIRDNTGTISAIVGGNSGFIDRGASSFLAITLRSGVDVGVEINDLFVENNRCTGVEGHFASLLNCTLCADVNIRKNKCDFGAGVQATSGINLTSNAPDLTAHYDISENEMTDFGTITLVRAEQITMVKNQWKWTAVKTTPYLTIPTGAFGILEYHRNKARNVDDAIANEISGTGPPTFTVLSLQDNITINDTGGVQMPIHNLGNTREDGTTVVTLTPTTSGTITLKAANQTLRYARRGNLVIVTGHIEVQSVAAPVGSVNLAGLKYPLSSIPTDPSYQAGVTIRATGLAAAATTAIQGFVEVGVDRIRLEQFAAGAAGALAGNIQANSAFYISAAYIASPLT